MGCRKLTYYESETALSEKWKIFAGGIEKTVSSSIFCKDYYAFGSLMPGRNASSGDYRYGFNSGSEKDDEISGSGNIYTTEWRMLDVRLGGRWWSPDRIVKPWESPYAGFANNPIFWTDPSGLNSEKDNPGGGNDDVWQSKDKDGNYTGEEEVLELDEVVVCGNCDGNSGGGVSDPAKGVEANNKVNRYKQNPALGRSTVFGIDDSKAGRIKNGKAVGEWVVRVDKPHPGTNYPHTNYNPNLTGVPDPHTRISNTTLKTVQGAGKVLNVASKVAKPLAIVVDAERIMAAVEQEQGNIMGKTVVVTASDVAGGWAGAAIGAAAGAKTGALAGGAIGVWFGGVGAVPGAAIGGFVGGLVGGITGGWLGSEAGAAAAETFYDE